MFFRTMGSALPRLSYSFFKKKRKGQQLNSTKMPNTIEQLSISFGDQTFSMQLLDTRLRYYIRKKCSKCIRKMSISP